MSRWFAILPHMSFRHIVSSLALAVGLYFLGSTVLFAQAPPPVPALPDTIRQTSYTISSSTCACSVGFSLYGDGTDYQDWIEVYVGTTKVSNTDATFGWIISSPTGPLGTIPRPINDAILTFNNAQSATITIVGSRRPRRLSQFLENRGVAARDLNQTITDLTAESREAWDKLQGALVGQPGETILRMPAKATRANQVLAFDSNGNPTVVAVPASIPTGTVTGPNSSTVGDIATFNNTLGTVLADTPVIGATHGGTGQSSLTAHGVVIGEGTSGVNVATTGTASAILVDQGSGNDPSFKVPSGDVSMTSSGVFSLSFIQTQGSGGITQKPSAKLLGAELYPDDYGAVDRSGVTDMGTLINTTIANAKTCGAAATAGNDVIRLRAGTYNITTPIVPKSCVTIVGDGRGKTILLTNHATPLLQTNNTQLVHFNLSGVTFKEGGTHASATAMTFQVIQGSVIRNIGFHGYTTGTAMNLSAGGSVVSGADDTTGIWNSNNSFFNTFEDWVEDDSMATGLIVAGTLGTPCTTSSATNVVTDNTFKDIHLWGITAVGWDLVRAADSNQFIGVNIIRLIGSGAAVNTPHASFKNIAVQLGDDNATCSGNNDIAMERMMLTVTMASPATSLIMFNAGNNTFGHTIDFNTDQTTSVNSGFTAMGGVTGLCYDINGRNYTTTLDDGTGNVFQLELDQCRYKAIMDGTATKPAMVFASDLQNGIYKAGTGVLGFNKGIAIGSNGGTGGTAQFNGATSGSWTASAGATGAPTMSTPWPVAAGGTGDTGTAWATFTPTFTCTSGTWTNNSARSKTLGKTTWIEIDATLGAAACTGAMTFTLPNTSNSTGSVNGGEIVVSNAAVACRFTGSTTTATCVANGGGNFAGTSRVVASGVYENQ